MSKRKSRLLRFFAVVVIILLLVAAFGAIWKFTRVGDKIVDLFDPTFRVAYNGKDYIDGNSVAIALPKGEQARFDVKSVNGYKIAITPNVTADTDFTYTVDGVEYKYSETNLSQAFLSQDNVQNDHFTLNALNDYSLASVLAEVYAGQSVVVDHSLAYPYLLTVTSDKATIRFLIGYITTSISFDRSNIVF